MSARRAALLLGDCESLIIHGLRCVHVCVPQMLGNSVVHGHVAFAGLNKEDVCNAGVEASVFNYLLLGLGVFQFPLTAWLAVRR